MTPISFDMQHQAKDIVLSEGLEGQDVNIDALTRLWEELQLASVEAAHPELDLISFASAPTTFYFAVITQKDEKNSESSPRESLDDVGCSVSQKELNLIYFSSVSHTRPHQFLESKFQPTRKGQGRCPRCVTRLLGLKHRNITCV